MSITYERFVKNLNDAASPKINLRYPSNQTNLIAQIQTEFKNSRLTLLLGAGVSIPSGLPSWSTITNRLVKKIFQTSEGQQVVRHIQSLSLSEPRKIRFLEESSAAFGLAVRDAMYERYTKGKKNKTLDAIANLAREARSRKRFLNIITYNVDDLLEERLTAIGCHFSVVSCEKSYRAAKERICIYHPHGYLPRDSDADGLLSSKLVFSERQYHDSFFDHTYWPNVIQRTSFERTTCLFIGCSLNDQNQRRLLDQTRNEETTHIALLKKCFDYRSSAKNQIQDYVTTQDVKSLGIEPFWLPDWNAASNVLAKV